MKFREEHVGFEEANRSMIGKTLSKVEYGELPYDASQGVSNPKPYYSTSYDNLDTIDFSIFLFTESGDEIEIYWDDFFYEYGVGIRINEPPAFPNYQKWTVSEDRIWKKLIGTQITDLKINWERSVANRKPDKVTYPQSIELTFSNGQQIFISAAEFLHKGDSEAFGMADHILVTDDEELARKVKMIV